MSSLNKVMLIGWLGQDAEMRRTQGGAVLASFSLATDERWKDGAGNQQERTEWTRCVLWGKAAESLRGHLVKGKQVYVEGSLQTRKWDDRNGVTRSTTEVKVRTVVLLGGGKVNGGASRQQREDNHEYGDDVPAIAGPSGSAGDVDDEIPF